MTKPSLEESAKALTDLFSRIVVRGKLPSPFEWEPPDFDDDLEDPSMNLAGDAAEPTPDAGDDGSPAATPPDPAR